MSPVSTSRPDDGEVIAVITEVTYSMLPSDDLERSVWGVKVAYRGRNRYAVQHHSEVLNRDGDWEYEPQPSSRDDAFIARTRFPYITACQLAAKHAPHVVANGMTARDVLRRRQEER